MSGHFAGRRSARTNDIAYLIDQARVCRIYVHQRADNTVDLECTRTHAMLFSGSIPGAVAFVRRQTTEAAS